MKLVPLKISNKIHRSVGDDRSLQTLLMVSLWHNASLLSGANCFCMWHLSNCLQLADTADILDKLNGADNQV